MQIASSSTQDSKQYMIPNQFDSDVNRIMNSSTNIPIWIQNQIPFRTADSGRIKINYGSTKINSLQTHNPLPTARYKQDSLEIDYRDTITKYILTDHKNKFKPLIMPEHYQSNSISTGGMIQDLKTLIRYDTDPIKKMDNIQKENFMGETSESFTHELNPRIDYNYMTILQSRALCICNYLKNNKFYKNYINNWKLLEKNLYKSGYLFERLDDSDSDVAYVINKGEEIKFRVRDSKRYVPINIYQYVLYHEMAHMSTNELQHTQTFYKLMSIIVFAAFENGFINFDNIPNSDYVSDGQPILSKKDIKNEIIEGAKLLFNTPENISYLQEIMKYLNKK